MAETSLEFRRKPTRKTKGRDSPAPPANVGFSRREAQAWIKSFCTNPHKHPLMAQLSRDPQAFAAGGVLERATLASARGPKLHLPPEALPLILP